MTYMFAFGVISAAFGVSAIAGLVTAVGIGTMAAGLGYTIASGEDAKKKQAQALSRQESAQASSWCR